MEGADWFTDPGPGSIAAAARSWVPLLLVWIGLLHYRRVRRARRAYWSLPASERELVVKAMLFVVHHGAIEKAQSAPGYARKPALVLADLLDLNRHTVDEGLRRLIEHGFLGGSRGASVWTLTTHIELTPIGRSFCERQFGSGSGYDLAPWGTLIRKAPAAGPAPSRGLILLQREPPEQDGARESRPNRDSTER